MKQINWNEHIDDDVHVYKQDGGHWFDGVVIAVSESGILLLNDGDSEIEVNPAKTDKHSGAGSIAGLSWHHSHSSLHLSKANAGDVD
jgi:hypothetical protein